MPTKPNATRPAAKTARKNPVKPQTSLARVHSSQVAEVRSQLAARPADGEIMAELAARFPATKLADRLEALMDAMTPPILTRSGEIVTKPDCSTRLKAIDLTLSYLVGRPIERSLSIRAEQAQTPEALLEEARKSPAMLDMLIEGLMAVRKEMQGGVSDQATASGKL